MKGSTLNFLRRRRQQSTSSHHHGTDASVQSEPIVLSSKHAGEALNGLPPPRKMKGFGKWTFHTRRGGSSSPNKQQQQQNDASYLESTWVKQQQHQHNDGLFAAARRRNTSMTAAMTSASSEMMSPSSSKILLPELSLAESQQSREGESSTEASYSSPMGCEIQVPHSPISSTTSTTCSTPMIQARPEDQHQDQNDDDDSSSSCDDEDDDSSKSSLLTAFSSDDDEEEASIVLEDTKNNIPRGMARLQKLHDRRDRKLRRMLVGKRKIYEMGLMRQEESVRRSSVQAYYESNSSPGDVHSCTVSSSSSSSSSSYHLQTIFHNVLFERHHTMPATMIVCMYALSNICFYLLLDSFAMRLKTLVSDIMMVRPDVYYASMLLLGMLILRFSGNLWSWISDKESYNLIKLQLHNREKLGYIDAKFHRWIRDEQSQTLQSCANLVGFYLMYWAIFNLYFYVLDDVLFPPLMEWYAGKEQELVEHLQLPEGVNVTCDAHLEYYNYNNNYNMMTGMVTYQLCGGAVDDWAVVANVSHVIMFTISVTIYALLGERFIESVD